MAPQSDSVFSPLIKQSGQCAVMAADEARDATLICLGGRVVKVDASMDAVHGWLLAGASIRQDESVPEAGAGQERRAAYTNGREVRLVGVAGRAEV